MKSGLIEAIKAVRYAPGVANWAEVGANAWRGVETTALRLRNGVVIEGAPGALLVPLYKEIFYRDEYGLRADPLPAGAVVVDVGANIGVFALYAAAAGASRVFAFEPFPDSFALLRRNAEHNRLASIVPRQLALAGESGTRSLFLAGRHGTNSLFGDGAAVQVECRTLADVFAAEAIERCHFLKLDCEGAEYEILLAAPAAVLARIDRMALEYHDAKTAHTHGELRAYLEHHGFAVRSRDHVPSRSGYLFAKKKNHR
jgi:FkbM family methyltransferase